MKLSSPAFQPNEQIPLLYTALGRNISPPLTFEAVPASTKSLALFVEDRDATPEPWIHWLVFDIPADAADLEEGSLPAGSVEGLANGGTPGYEGPNQPYFQGTHHYYFHLYALDTTLDIPVESRLSDVLAAAEDHVLDKAELPVVCTSPEPA